MIFKVPLPGGQEALIRSTDVSLATTHVTNDKWTDVYIDRSAESGLTIAISIEEFGQLWLTAETLTEEEINEMRLLFEQGAMH
jgi:hypothetical protein